MGYNKTILVIVITSSHLQSMKLAEVTHFNVILNFFCFQFLLLFHILFQQNKSIPCCLKSANADILIFR